MRIQKSEPVQLVAKTHGYFPASFRWRGRRFDVVAVEKCWTVSSPAVRRLFRVRCQAGWFILQQAVADDHWQVNRWPLTLWLPRLRRPAPPRFPLPRYQRRPVVRARSWAVSSSAKLAVQNSSQAPQADAVSPRVGSLVPVQVKVAASAPRRNQWTATINRS